MDQGLLTGMIFINLQKVFDTIDHEILLQKFKAIRSWKGTIQWFRSYSERIFLVNFESKLSDFTKIFCGVPQGSILSTLLFLSYVNNLPEAVKLTFICRWFMHLGLTQKNWIKSKNSSIETLKKSVTDLWITN